MKILQAFTILFFSILLGFNNKAHAVTDWNMSVNTIGNIGWTVIPFLIFAILALLFWVIPMYFTIKATFLTQTEKMLLICLLIFAPLIGIIMFLVIRHQKLQDIS